MFCFSRLIKPQSFADCVGDELPLGWEEVYDPNVGVYYINHINRKYQFFHNYVFTSINNHIFGVILYVNLPQQTYELSCGSGSGIRAFTTRK